MTDVSISRVADLLGVPAPTIRSWERRYGVARAPRTSGKHRRYTTEEVSELTAMRDAIARGLSARAAAAEIRDGRTMPEGPVENVVAAAQAMDERTMRRHLNAAKRSSGIEAAVQDVVLPAMRRIGENWETGTCDVAHEHLATSVVRSWLGAQTRLPANPDADVLLACGPQDAHSIGLEAFAVVLCERGITPRLLGPLTPRDSLLTAALQMKPRAIVVTSHQRVFRSAAVRALESVKDGSKARLFYAGNAFATTAGRRAVPGRFLGDDVSKAADLVQKAIG